jgi:predicted DNA-binding protein (UPF0251 family)
MTANLTNGRRSNDPESTDVAAARCRDRHRLLGVRPMSNRSVPEGVLTKAELGAWLLADRGMSQRNIALALGVSRSTIRSRLENAARKLAQAQKEPAA